MCGLITSPRCAPALRGLPDAGQGERLSLDAVHPATPRCTA
jgi:hypothetical protein